MSDIDHLSLFTRFSGFRIMILANRLACDNATARQAHDRLLTKLGDVVQLTREALAAARDLSLAGGAESNRTVHEDLAWIEEKLGAAGSAGRRIRCSTNSSSILPPARRSMHAAGAGMPSMSGVHISAM